MSILKKLGVIFLLITLISCSQQKKYVSYKVKKGDTMETIAKQHEISKSQLFKINPGIHRDPPPNTILIVPKTANAKKNEEENEKEEE